MLGFLSDELVWAIARERGDELRATHPHTRRRPDVEAVQAQSRMWLWLDGALKIGSTPIPGATNSRQTAH